MSKLYSTEDISDKEKEIFLHWSIMNNRIEDFRKKSKLSTFNFLFGPDGQKLMNHYRHDCNEDYVKFKSYLFTSQINTLFINILLNKELYLQ